MYPPVSTGALVTGGLLTFGAGMATAALIGGGFGWGSNDVYVNNNYHGGGGGEYHGHANGHGDKEGKKKPDVNPGERQTPEDNPRKPRRGGERHPQRGAGIAGN